MSPDHYIDKLTALCGAKRMEPFHPSKITTRVPLMSTVLNQKLSAHIQSTVFNLPCAAETLGINIVPPTPTKEERENGIVEDPMDTRMRQYLFFLAQTDLPDSSRKVEQWTPFFDPIIDSSCLLLLRAMVFRKLEITTKQQIATVTKDHIEEINKQINILFHALFVPHETTSEVELPTWSANYLFGAILLGLIDLPLQTS